ncbi:hypothetical protein PybrP1_004313 [[Pythium] brassicae (nom. inval.)]|nr:hypothetical protein PybrP1_004313 [[Pythium] brassicae (nom. inval.)]
MVLGQGAVGERQASVQFVGVFAAEAELSGEETPAGFQDTPGQWYTAIPRKRGAGTDGEATLRDSQATERQSAEPAPPVFVCAAGSLGGGDSDFAARSMAAAAHTRPLREEELAEEVDEDETQIVMSLSQDHGVRASGRKIEEEQLGSPTATARLEAIPSASDDDDGADSDMSDDMLAHDGPSDHISTLAATFQRQDTESDEQSRRRAPVPVYRSRTHSHHTPALSVGDDDAGSGSSSSGVETEVEGEPESSVGSQDVVRLARARSSSDHSNASEREPETQQKQWPRRFRLGGGDNSVARLRASERSDSAASDATNVEEDAPVHTKKKPAARRAAIGARSPTMKTTKKKKRRSSSEDASQASTASATEPATATARPPFLAATAAVGESKRQKSSEAASEPSHQSATREVRIVLTGLEPTPAIRKKIKAIGDGAVYEEDIERATHVVAPKNQLKRTVKLLCGISRCEHILDEQWLDDSARAGAPLSEQDYCLLDAAAQLKWRFDLRKTMYAFAPAQRRQLFAGHRVFITNHKSVLPPVKDLVKIVECAGGRAEVKGSAGPADVVITSEAALGVSSVLKALASANPQRIYSPELILSSILQQHIDFDMNRLTLPGGDSTKKRACK